MPFGVPLTPALAASLRHYLALLLRWNQKINLTASSDVNEILSRHIGESLFGARLLPEAAGTLYDVGAGAGFPGLPLKLARPDWELVLVESDHRKAAFLSEAIRVLNLDRARVLAERFDRLPTTPPLADVITARALGQYQALLDWSRRALRPSGKVLLWLGSRDAATLSQVPGWLWDPPVPLPNSEERVVLAGQVNP
jgi:16S rRNA (guanine527-N7)-methyltransferase